MGTHGNQLDRLPAHPQTHHALALWKNTLERSKNTIEKKINALGLTEATVQQRREDADSELLVQMPGTDDPTRAKQIIQTAGVLEIYDVKGGPFASRDEAPRNKAAFCRSAPAHRSAF